MKKIDKEIFKDVTLLYVEDDEMTVEEISFFLKKYVKELHIAKNGEEGLELFKKYNPDMVITDIQMPVMNGLDMCEKILEINPTIPIAITTAYSDADFLIRAIGLGIDKYLLKPINMLEMLAVIQKSLDLRTSTNIDTGCEDYIQFILDSNPTFMFILHADKIEYANKKFLDLLGHENITSLKEHIQNTENIFEFENLDTQENWMDYIIDNSDKSYLMSLNKSFVDKNFSSKFYVTHKYFKSANKRVFIFVDSDEEKLHKINDIAKKMLSNDKIKDIIRDDINNIIRLSSNN